MDEVQTRRGNPTPDYEESDRVNGELIQIAAAIWKARALYAAAELGLADLVVNGHRTVDELAKASGAYSPSLARLMRVLVMLGVFVQCETGRFNLGRIGAALRKGTNGREIVRTLGGDWQWKAWEKFLQSVRTGESGLFSAFGTDLFGYLATDKDASASFNQAMIGIHAPDYRAMIQACDFSRFRNVVDVGGGTGTLLTRILQSNESVRGILFDLPETMPEASRVIDACGLSTRCDLVAGDFFEQVPAGHDAYILAHVIHDWADAQAIEILRNCRKATAKDGRLFILETVLPRDDAPHDGKLFDLLMLTITGGIERTAEEYKILLNKAAFEVARVDSVSANQSVIMARPI
jgi:ubiquinone/menaquinone biosynthesis C-methylase UbiE